MWSVAMSQTRNIALTAAAATTAVITVFAGIPAIVYGANEAAFSWPLLNLLPLYLPFAAGIFLILVLPVTILPSHWGRYWAAGVVVIAVYLWAHGSFQTHDFGSIDGLNFSPNVPLLHSIVEIVAITGAAALIFAYAIKMPKIASIIIIAPTVSLLVQGLPTIFSAPAAQLTGASRVGEIANLSLKSNVLVLLFDAMQSDVFEHLVQGTPELAQALDGFTLYTDTLGAASTTYLTMPTVHSGRTYDGETLLEFFRETVEKQSVLTMAAEGGYRGIVVNEIQRTCPEKLQCITSLAAMSGDHDSVVSEAAVLMDSVLFRIAPLALKDVTYNHGNWVIQPHTIDKRFPNRIIEGNEFLRQVGSAFSTTAETPQLRFIHLFNTHPPFILREDCSYDGRELPFNQVNIERQVSCALDALADMLAGMKEAGVYDQTHIIIMSDTGIGLDSTRTVFPTSLAIRMGQASPTFAVKPAGASGTFRVDPKQVHIGDFGATLCDLTDACLVESGRPVRFAPQIRTRVFNQYSWRHEYWFAETIPDLVQYRIIGPLGDSSSWFPGPLREIAFSERIQFAANTLGTELLGHGWHGPETWGVWSGVPSTSIFATLPSQVPANLNLRIAALGFVRNEHPNLSVVVKVNDKPVGTLEFSLDVPSLEVSIPVDRTLVDTQDGALKITFENRTAASPAELGISDDPRVLGIGLQWIAIEQVPA
jgi:hypothetical protein